MSRRMAAAFGLLWLDVAEDDHVAWPQGGGELGLDVEVEEQAMTRHRFKRHGECG